jgi:hypothetical protein
VHVISANRLSDGIVVYLGGGSAWVERFCEAKVFAAKAEADIALLAAQDDIKRNLVVDPNLVEVKDGSRGVRPAALREAIRAQGPTIDYLPRAVAPPGNTTLPKEDGARPNAIPISRPPPREDAGVSGAHEPSLTTA